ncbi:MFS transporter [Streptomyces xiaopingdaonensis]|uniref:MFS transporter n=1 Tax=Streptomyces xiaopingdaonensis TaxID=1565415 RepID=UPI00037FF978|nr:MFS transporter [Streptomyces xiaopingdaonensis]
MTAADGDADRTRTAGLFSDTHRSRTLPVAAAFVLLASAAFALNTVMPVAAQSLDGMPWYAVAFGGYLTASLVGTVLGGRWADQRGPATPLFVSGLCFVTGSILAGAALSMPMFLVGRFLQGLGGGALTVTLYVVVGHGYPSALRPRMFSLVTACWVLPSMIGPFVAGAVTEHLSWRWVFHGIAVLALGTLGLLRRPLSGLRAHESAPPGRSRLIPAVLVALGVGVLQYAGSRPSPLTAGLSVAALVAVAACLPRLLPAGTLRARRGVPSLVLLRGFAAAGYFVVESYIPLLLVKAHHWTPTEAGASLTFASLSWAGASWLQGRPGLRLPRARVVQLGALTHTAGVAAVMVGVARELHPVAAPAGFVVSAFGMGLLLPGIGVLVLDRSPTGLHGARTAALQLADSLCSVLLIGVCGALFNALSTGTTAFTTVFAAAVATTVVACLTARRIDAPQETDHAPLRPHRPT